MRRLVLAVLISAAGLGAGRAAPVAAAAPWAPDRCDALAARFSEATGLTVTTGPGAPGSVLDSAPPGNACLFAAEGSGLTRTFADTLQRLQTVLEGWAPVPEMAADGPDATLQGFRKGDRRVIVRLERAPPKGTCETVVQAACKVPAKRWLWNFRAAAYRA